ncbi:MAG: hypothetical protein COT43_00185 [Candidatus Marinimicrobia bacterium CG08_land_8_20_14_0_20_45_22]|nr:MAG: hypothetical protein COT43_00185 [Candidatus Marinimicrobia bacterium CG08_land_8_20_14_0_20_45_22]
MDLSSLNTLEEKIKSLLFVITELRSENLKMKTDLKEGSSIEVMLDQKKRHELRNKVEGLLELLKDF